MTGTVRLKIMIIGMVALGVISMATAYGYTVVNISSEPQFDLVVSGHNIAEIQEDYTIFIEAQDSRFTVPSRHLLPYVNFTVQTMEGDRIIQEQEGNTQKKGKTVIAFFITTHDYQREQFYNATVTAYYNDAEYSETITFWLTERGT